MTLLDDDSLLVYRTIPGNPAKLKPGDVLLGCDGKPWRELLATIETWKLPFCGDRGTTDPSEDTRLMEAIVLNLHLFEALDVLRYGTDQVDHLPTEDIIGGESYPLACSDQLPVPGISFPWTDFTEHEADGKNDISGGIISGTNIGYIYVYSWRKAVGERFEQLVGSLLDTDGLIIDTRYDMGGFLSEADGGLRLLFNEQIVVAQMAMRDFNSDDFDAMEIVGQLVIEGDPQTYYDRPIAVLTGPKSISMGDIFPYMMSFHPRARRFGRSTDGAFGSSADASGAFDYSYSPMLFADNEGNWLHRSVQTPEEEVWLTREDVVNGVDTVVEAALAWIAEENAKQRL